MPWWDGPMLGFDLETTSKLPEDARIVSAALVSVGPKIEGQERGVTKATWLVNPGVEIPQEAIDVHGITNERARVEGADPLLVLGQIATALQEAATIGCPVVIHNASYDLTTSDRELRRVGIDPAFLRLLLVVDPIVLDKHLDRFRPKEPKRWRQWGIGTRSLEDCCRVWNVPLEGVAHDAAFDAIAACRLAWRLATGGRVIRRTRDEDERREFVELTQEWEAVRGDLRQLHAWQQRIKRAESERLEAWFRKGDVAKGVPPMPNRVCPRDWPIVPVGFDWGDPTPVGEAPESTAELLTPEWTI